MNLKGFLLRCIVLITSAQLAAFGQQPAQFNLLSKPQKHLLYQIAKYGKVESRNIGWTGIYSEQYARFDSLARMSTENDILLFIKHRSPAVKIYAFQKLLERQNLDLAFVVLQDNFQDTTAFLLQNGCSKGANIVGKSMYSRLKSATEKEGTTCSDRQKVVLAEIDKKLPNYSHVKRMVARQIKYYKI